MDERQQALAEAADCARKVAEKYHERAYPNNATSTTDVAAAEIARAFMEFAAQLAIRSVSPPPQRVRARGYRRDCR